MQLLSFGSLATNRQLLRQDLASSQFNYPQVSLGLNWQHHLHCSLLLPSLCEAYPLEETLMLVLAYRLLT
jgi:hypothetical protein